MNEYICNNCSLRWHVSEEYELPKKVHCPRCNDTNTEIINYKEEL